MSCLSPDKQTQVVAALVEGVSINAPVRITGVAKHTVLNLLRDLGCEYEFMQDCAKRIIGRPQITTDQHRSYLRAVEEAFGADADYAMLHKIYGAPTPDESRYSPATCIGCETVSARSAKTAVTQLRFTTCITTFVVFTRRCVLRLRWKQV